MVKQTNPVASRSGSPRAILFLGTPFLPETVEMVRARGYHYLSVNRSIGAQEALYADGAIMCNLNDNDAVRAAVQRLAERWSIKAFLSFNEYRVEFASILAKDFGLPYALGVSQVRYKHRMRQILADYGVPVPRFATVRSQSEIGVLQEEFVLPVVVKPVNESGSRRVRLCHTWAEVTIAVREIIEGSNYVGSGAADVCLVEEFVAGPEYSVECFSWRGKTRVVAITEKLTTMGPFFVELQHVVPASLSKDLQDQIAGAALQAIASTGLDGLVSHVEVRWDVDRCRPCIIEINPRPGGDRIPELVQAVTGWNLREVAVAIALGKDPVSFVSPSKPSANTAGIRFFHAKDEGICVHPKDLCQQLGVREFRMYVKSGQRVPRTQDNFTRLGYMLAWATNREQLESVFEKGLRAVSVSH